MFSFTRHEENLWRTFFGNHQTRWFVRGALAALTFLSSLGQGGIRALPFHFTLINDGTGEDQSNLTNYLIPSEE